MSELTWESQKFPKYARPFIYYQPCQEIRWDRLSQLDGNSLGFIIPIGTESSDSTLIGI